MFYRWRIRQEGIRGFGSFHGSFCPSSLALARNFSLYHKNDPPLLFLSFSYYVRVNSIYSLPIINPKHISRLWWLHFSKISRFQFGCWTIYVGGCLPFGLAAIWLSFSIKDNMPQAFEIGVLFILCLVIGCGNHVICFAAMVDFFHLEMPPPNWFDEIQIWASSFIAKIKIQIMLILEIFHCSTFLSLNLVHFEFGVGFAFEL